MDGIHELGDLSLKFFQDCDSLNPVQILAAPGATPDGALNPIR